MGLSVSSRGKTRRQENSGRILRDESETAGAGTPASQQRKNIYEVEMDSVTAAVETSAGVAAAQRKPTLPCRSATTSDNSLQPTSTKRSKSEQRRRSGESPERPPSTLPRFYLQAISTTDLDVEMEQKNLPGGGTDLSQITEYESQLVATLWRRMTTANPNYCDNALNRLLQQMPELDRLFGVAPFPPVDPCADGVGYASRNKALLRTQALRTRSFLTRIVHQLEHGDAAQATHSCRQLGVRHARLYAPASRVQTEDDNDVASPPLTASLTQQLLSGSNGVMSFLQRNTIVRSKSTSESRKNNKQSPIPPGAWLCYADCFNKEMHASLDTTDVGDREIQLLTWKNFIDTIVQIMSEAYQLQLLASKRTLAKYSAGSRIPSVGRSKAKLT